MQYDIYNTDAMDEMHTYNTSESSNLNVYFKIRRSDKFDETIPSANVHGNLIWKGHTYSGKENFVIEDGKMAKLECYAGQTQTYT